MATYENGVQILGYVDSGLVERAAPLGSPPRNPSTPVPIDLRSHFPTSMSIGTEQVLPEGIGLFYPGYWNALHSVTFPGQWYPRQSDAGRAQTLLMAGSGQLSVYDSGRVNGVISLTLRQLSEIKRERLFCFLVNIVKGAMYTFEYWERIDITDPLYYTVRWVGDFQTLMAQYPSNELVIQLRKE